MKSYEEMAESVLARRDRYVVSRRRKMWKTASVVVCFAAVLGIGIRYTGILDHGLEADTDIIDNDAKSKKEMSYDTDDTDDTRKEHNTVDKLLDDAYDKPVAPNPENTGALTAYEAVWGGSYMDDAGRWVILLTENTAENREKVFQRNPTLREDNTVFKEAAYSRSYLMDLMDRLNKAELPFIVSSIGFREERNRIEVTVTADEADAIEEILSFDTIGGAIEIICLSNIQIDENTIK